VEALFEKYVRKLGKSSAYTLTERRRRAAESRIREQIESGSSMKERLTERERQSSATLKALGIGKTATTTDLSKSLILGKSSKSGLRDEPIAVRAQSSTKRRFRRYLSLMGLELPYDLARFYSFVSFCQRFATSILRDGVMTGMTWYGPPSRCANVVQFLSSQLLHLGGPQLQPFIRLVSFCVRDFECSISVVVAPVVLQSRNAVSISSLCLARGFHETSSPECSITLMAIHS
jgi:hypothetical protein